MGHWYTKDGQPCHEQPKKAGGGMRATTLADARKLNLLPSVTTILDDVIRKPALEAWKARQAVMAVVTAPDVPGESLDDKITRVLDTENQAGEEAKQARDLGTEIHDALEKALNGQPYNPEMEPYVKPVSNEFLLHPYIFKTEFTIVGDGYAGRCDLAAFAEEQVTLWDFKTTKKLPTQAYTEHRLQLAAYAEAYYATLDTMPIKLETGNIYISTTEPGKFTICMHEGWVEAFDNGFEPILKYWQWMKQYKPQ